MTTVAILPRRARPGLLRPTQTGTGKLITGASIIVLLGLAGWLVPVLTGVDPVAQDLSQRLLPPSSAHFFGTDEFGRDVFVRAFAAATIDLPLAIFAALLPSTIGSVLGLLAGYGGKTVDTIIMRIGDLLQAFPSYILLVIVAFILGPGVTSFLVAISIISWVSYARLVRSQVVVIRELDYVHAARLSGIGSRRVMFRHVLPNALPQVIVYLAADATLALILLSGLSFLGLGIPQPAPEWGLMIQSGRIYVGTAWWLSTFPGLLIVIAAAGFSLISDALDDRSRV